VVLTAVRMRRRFERHVDWKIAVREFHCILLRLGTDSAQKQKAIVTPDWLRDSKKAGRPLPCGDYAALPELEEETADNCPDQECPACDNPHSPSHKPRSSPTNNSVPSPAPRASLGAAPTVKPTDATVFNNWGAKYAVQRASPLVCPNQGLANELSILCHDRELEGLARNALAYERAIGLCLPSKMTSWHTHLTSTRR
jgi:DNA polymerase mu